MTKDSKTIKAYEFFVEAEKNKTVFTLDEIVNATGWSKQTVIAYKTKKWHYFLKEVPNGLISEGISITSKDAFLRFHAQKAIVEDNLLRPKFTPNIDALIDKSQETAMLGVQTYNNPLIKFRAPGYIVYMIIAYTALFHAIFEKNGVEYWYKNADGTPQIVDGDFRYWELASCVKNYYKGLQTPETENLTLFINLRNKIEHRFIPALDLTISGYCQALLLNFEKLLVKEFGDYFVLGQNNLALALQLSEYSSHQQTVLRKIQSKHFDAVKNYIDTYRNGLPDDILISNSFCFRAFLIPIIGNNAKSSDISIQFVQYDADNPEEMEHYEKHVAFIKQKLVQVADQGQLKASDVVSRVKQETNLNFNIKHHINAWKLYKVRPIGVAPEKCIIKFCQYNVPFKSYIYTEEWVKFLCEKIRDPDEFERIKKYRADIVI